MDEKIRQLLRIDPTRLDALNSILLDPDMKIINNFLEVVEKYGTPDEINKKAEQSGKLATLLKKVEATKPEYLKDLEWLKQQRDKSAFINVADYRHKVLGEKSKSMDFLDDFAVTLEVSACQYFPWIIIAAKKAIEQRLLMPGRFIKVRKMKEQELDGDLPAIAASMNIIGASYVETLDTQGTDGSNIHLGGPGTITGYFGGVGQPNNYPVKWIEEYLGYYTRYGVRQGLNLHPGTGPAA